MTNKRKFAIILSNYGQFEVCKYANLAKIKNQRLLQKKRLFIKKCNKETVQLIAVHYNYEILNELIRNLNEDIPRVKIENLENSDSVLSNDYNDVALKDNRKFEISQSPVESYEIVKSSSMTCILKASNSTLKASCCMNSESLIINQNTIIADEREIDVQDEKVFNSTPTIISDVPFCSSVLVLPSNLKPLMPLDQSDLLESQVSTANESLNNILSESQVLTLNESLNNELNWSWDGDTLMVPQCEDVTEDVNQSIQLTLGNEYEATLNSTLYDLTEKTKATNLHSKQIDYEKKLVHSVTKDFQNNSDFSDSHSEYILSEHSSEEDEQHFSNNTSANKSSRKSKSFNSSINSGLDISLMTNIHGKSSRNDEEMYVQSAPPPGSKRIFRKHFCLFCKSWQSKISRHLENKHKNEKRVKDFIDLPKKSNERKHLIDMLRKEGDFYYNVNNDVNTGELVVCRKPSGKLKNTAKDYACCPKCKGLYNKLNLRHHTARCIDNKRKGSKICPVLSRQVIGRYASQADNVLRQIVMPRCHEDRVTRIIRYDELVMEHGNKLCLKYPSPHHHAMIRQRLRQLGRFLLEIKNHRQDIDDLSSVYQPKYYKICIDTINILAGFDSSTRTYKIPSLATSLGTLLKAAGKTLISLSIFQENVVKQKQVENFLTLLNNEYGPAINKVALETQQQLKRKKKVILPSIEDIKKLDSFLKVQRATSFKNLKEKFSFKDWLQLSESTLISIQLFNRRRAGEMERTLIEDYENYQKIDTKSVKEFNALSSECQKLAIEYVRFTIRGKLNRNVPVLLDSELQKCIELILKHRKNAGVRLANPYVFGIPNIDRRKHTYLRACDLMRRFSVECGADQPETLRGTALRKHVATLGVNLNLTDSEIIDLANFMGHEEKIHREHYRMPIVHREILRMSKLLQSASGKDHENTLNNKKTEKENSAENEMAPSTSNYDFNISFIKDQQNENKSGKKIDQDLSSDSSDTDTLEAHLSKKKRSTSPYGKCKRVPWNETEKKLVLDSFGSYIFQKKLPSLHDIQNLIKKNPAVLKRRTAVMIKAWLMNQRKKQTQY